MPGDDAPIIQDITQNVETEEKEAFIATQKDIQDTIDEIIQEKGQANQSVIIDRLLQKQLVSSRTAAQRALENGTEATPIKGLVPYRCLKLRPNGRTGAK